MDRILYCEKNFLSLKVALVPFAMKTWITENDTNSAKLFNNDRPYAGLYSFSNLAAKFWNVL